MFGSLSLHFSYAGVSGFGNNEVLLGRLGGCAILWRNDIHARVQILHVDVSKRISAVRFHCDSFCLLFMSVYMPNEGDESRTTCSDYAEHLAITDSPIEANTNYHVIIAGDFTVDLSRQRIHIAMLQSFCTDVGVSPVALHQSAKFDYSYHFGTSRFSLIYHFLLSDTLFSNAVNCAYVVHDVNNTSDHEPIFLQLDLDVEFIKLAGRVRTPRTSWTKAKVDDLQQYHLCLSNYLYDIPLPHEALLCRDVTCCNAEHVRAINAYTNDITAACTSAAERILSHKFAVGNRVGEFLVGPNMCCLLGRSHYFGIGCG